MLILFLTVQKSRFKFTHVQNIIRCHVKFFGTRDTVENSVKIYILYLTSFVLLCMWRVFELRYVEYRRVAFYEGFPRDVGFHSSLRGTPTMLVAAATAVAWLPNPRSYIRDT